VFLKVSLSLLLQLLTFSFDHIVGEHLHDRLVILFHSPKEVYGMTVLENRSMGSLHLCVVSVALDLLKQNSVKQLVVGIQIVDPQSSDKLLILA